MPIKKPDFADDNTFTQKIDVLDLLINVIREEEEKLEELVTRLEIVASIVEERCSEAGDTSCIHQAVDLKEYLTKGQ
ncbi:MAG: hypothetical protein ACTSPB_01130 [Candidatus Thorarchaeota archaeon]